MEGLGTSYKVGIRKPRSLKTEALQSKLSRGRGSPIQINYQPSLPTQTLSGLGGGRKRAQVQNGAQHT